MSKLFPNLMVDDMAGTLAFYESLGFAVESKLPPEAPVWAMVTFDGVVLMFQTRESLVAEFPQFAQQGAGGALTLWISTPNVEQLYSLAQAHPGIVKPLGVTDYNGANEFVLRDPNGFLLHVSDMVL